MGRREAILLAQEKQDKHGETYGILRIFKAAMSSPCRNLYPVDSAFGFANIRCSDLSGAVDSNILDFNNRGKRSGQLDLIQCGIRETQDFLMGYGSFDLFSWNGMRQNLGTDIVSGKTTVFGKGMAKVRDAGLSPRRRCNMGSGHLFQTLIEENTTYDQEVW